MTLLTQQVTHGSTTTGTTVDLSYAALNASTTKILIGIESILLDGSDPGVSSVTFDQGGNNESCSERVNAEASITYAGDRYVQSTWWYLDSPTDLTAGTLRVVWASTMASIATTVFVYEFDSEADSGGGGAVGTQTGNTSTISIDITTGASDHIILLGGFSQVADANPFTASGVITEDYDGDNPTSGAYFGGHGDATGGSDTGGYTLTTARRTAASMIEVQQTVTGDDPFPAWIDTAVPNPVYRM